jgi:hypothetical protein
LDTQKTKKYRFSLKTLHMDSDLYVTRKGYKNSLYVYVYEKTLLGITLLLSIKVTVYECE